MSAKTRKWIFLAFVAVLFMYKNRIRKIYKFLMEVKAARKLLEKLPGPGEEGEHFLLGHYGGKFFLGEDGSATPEWIVNNTVRRLTELCKPYREDGIMRMFVVSRSVPFVCFAVIMPLSIEVVREMTSQKNMDQFDKGKSYTIAHPLIGDSVLPTSGPEWAAQRPILERGFSHDIVGKAVPKMVQSVNELVEKWEKKARASRNTAIQDVEEDMLRLTMDVIGRAAFGYDFNSTVQDEAPLYEPFHTILHLLERRSQYIHEYILRDWPLEVNVKLNKAIAKLDECVDAIQNSRLKETDQDRASREVDFLDMLMKDKAMSPSLVKDNIKTLLFAGHDTTGAALAWFFYLLAKHPHHMERVREEVLARFGKNGNPSYDELETVHFLNACLLETLRLYPSAGFTKQPKGDVEIAGYVIPKFTEIFFLPYLLHRDERYWGADANEFRPERFLHEGYETGSNRNLATHETGSNRTLTNYRMDSLQSRIGRISKDKAYFPFSLGPRNCVGRPLALAEMRIVAIKLLQKFSFQTCEDNDFREIPTLTLTLNPKSIKLIPVLVNDDQALN